MTNITYLPWWKDDVADFAGAIAHGSPPESAPGQNPP